MPNMDKHIEKRVEAKAMLKVDRVKAEKRSESQMNRKPLCTQKIDQLRGSFSLSLYFFSFSRLRKASILKVT